MKYLIFSLACIKLLISISINEKIHPKVFPRQEFQSS